MALPNDVQPARKRRTSTHSEVKVQDLGIALADASTQSDVDRPYPPPKEDLVAACQRIGMPRSAVEAWARMAYHPRSAMTFYFVSGLVLQLDAALMWFVVVEHNLRLVIWGLLMPGSIFLLSHGAVLVYFWRLGPEAKRHLPFKVLYLIAALSSLECCIINAIGPVAALPFQNRLTVLLTTGLFYFFFMANNVVNNPALTEQRLGRSARSLVDQIFFGMDMTLKALNVGTDLCLAVELHHMVCSTALFCALLLCFISFVALF